MYHLKIKSTIKNYEVFFIHNLQKQLLDITSNYFCHFLIDSNIARQYKKELTKMKGAKSIHYFNAKEKYKNLKQVHTYIEYLLDNKIQKKHKIVVIGGGLVQDVGSFTAHIIKRGIEWIFIPTTLLSMSDSCIGAKSGINVGKYKNQVGSFHPPIEIYIYTGWLHSLSKNDFINGIGEIVKHGLIKGGIFYTNLENRLEQIYNDQNAAEKIIYESLLIKKSIVEEDELEKGIRKLLNYGHTFGHALEGYTKNTIAHGLGVLIGMDLANYISMKRQYLNIKEFQTIHTFLKKLIPVKKISISDISLYMKFLATDKKVVGNEVDAILSKGIGKIEIIRTKMDGELRKNIKDYLQFFNYG